MTVKRILLLTICHVLILGGCSQKKVPPEEFTAAVEKIRSSYAPDKRTSVFDLEIEYRDGQWELRGETSSHQAYEELNGLASQTFQAGGLANYFQLLPPASFADTVYALVNVSVGNLRKNPRHAAEMVDQVLMGTELKLLKAESYWYLVQTAYDYLGWISRGTITRLSAADLQNWQKGERFTWGVNWGQVFERPSEKSQVVCDLVLNDVLKKRSDNGSWTAVELPDGRSGYALSKNLRPFRKVGNKVTPGRTAIVDRAKTLMGIPYLWGGNSTKGLDCSGFTSTVFKSEGFQLPRDANMQVLLGKEIIPEADFSNILGGDLIFFGPPDRITHVGICLGGSYFIHSSDDVHINSLDEKDMLFNAYRKRTMRQIRRIIDEGEKP